MRPGAIEFSNVDLGTVVKNATDDLSELAKRRSVSVSVKLSDFRIVFGNATALTQIVVNILKNAISYSSTGGHVAVAVSPDYRGAIKLTVEDAGPGILEKDLFRIFEPFYRGGASRARNDGGSGLGLAIVSELVHLHNGKIVVRSTPRHGTTIIVSLPAGTAPEEESALAEERQRHGKGGEVAIDFSK